MTKYPAELDRIADKLVERIEIYSLGKTLSIRDIEILEVRSIPIPTGRIYFDKEVNSARYQETEIIDFEHKIERCGFIFQMIYLLLELDPKYFIGYIKSLQISQPVEDWLNDELRRNPSPVHFVISATIVKYTEREEWILNGRKSDS